MADDPVDNFLQFIGYGLQRGDAERLLRISSNNLETAVNKFYDVDGDPSRIQALLSQSNTTWDETAFGANRYGQPDDAGGSGIPTFNIEYAPGVDNYPHSGLQSGAPSRPPSRTSQRSGVSAHGDVPQQSIENGQELGVISNSRPTFGPATKDYYDTNSWALVPSTTSTEYVPDPTPSRRRREEGEPAFLKPLPGGDHLPALLAILHSIPQFRNALLAPEISQRTYWMGDEWWKGSPSASARTIDNASDTQVTREVDLLCETQRLMAFLDTTDRAYASVDPVLQLDAWKESSEYSDRLGDFSLRFLLIWSSAYQNRTSQKQLNGLLRSVFDAGGQKQESFVLDAPVVRQDSTSDLTLYDVLDQALFSTPAGNAHIVDISNVLILRLESSKSDATRLDCKIPAIFYADRYLEKNKATIDEMFLEMKQYEDQLKEIDVKVQKLKYHIPKKSGQTQPLDSLRLIKTSMRAFEPRQGSAEQDPRDAAILFQLQSVYSSIERKLEDLDVQRNKIRETLNNISSRFKAPIGNETELMDTADGATTNKADLAELEHPYKLVGVATRDRVVHFLHPDIKSDVAGAKQWWRIEYSTATEDAFIFKDRKTLSEVLKHAEEDWKSALLVYANEDALSEAPLPLSTALQDFVKKDNLNFLEELQQNVGADDLPAYSGSFDDSAWANISAQAYHDSKANSGISSATLTPNTEHDDEGVGMEMLEVNGGIDTWAGNAHSNASSDTVGGEAMDIIDSQRSQTTINYKDVEMTDTEGTETREEPRVQHIEVVEKKGG